MIVESIVATVERVFGKSRTLTRHLARLLVGFVISAKKEKTMKVKGNDPEMSACLTPDKVYEVTNLTKNNMGDEAFNIVDDNGNERFCLFVGCAHLDGGAWTIV
jgi:hypothetical protein